MASNDCDSKTGTALHLSHVEATLRTLLLDVAEHIDSSPEPAASSTAKLSEPLSQAKLELRFTGGWVRDKLLGVESHDIDVAINKMTGYQFGLRMRKYLETPRIADKYTLHEGNGGKSTTDKSGNVVKSLAGGLHKIEANPEKSKHLETVTTKILGLDIDLVNLRKESYTEDSRNPQMEFGSPEEDALRRDATVNALFYNLHTSLVEDFTGKGLDDMKQKIIRTPMEPYQTFKDDPLRVLRLIRFASRLNYTIEPATKEAMKNPDIREALRAKISRERVGVELEKMLKGPDPCTSLSLIEQSELYGTIFTDPTRNVEYEADLSHWTTCYQTLAEILAASDANVASEAKTDITAISSVLIQNSDDKYLMWLVAAVTPLSDAPAIEPSKPSTKPPIPYAGCVAREGIKATNKVVDILTAAMRNSDDVRTLKDKFISRTRQPSKVIEGDDATARDTLGMAIRRWGASWRIQVGFALLYEVMATPNSRMRILADYAQLLNRISELGLLDAYSIKPLVDGKALAKALETQPGPWMKTALDIVMAWQLRNPDKTDAEEAIEEIRSRKGELTKSLAEYFLKLTIRPLFAKSQHPAVTAQGRKATTQPLAPRHTTFPSDDAKAKPWKGDDSYALDLLEWVLKGLDAPSVEKHWPLLIPPLLAIIDDVSLPVKARGCEFLLILLEAMPTSLLARTGLSEIFEEALMPCLSYLPTLTPVDESVIILNAAFPALFALADKRYHPSNSMKAPEISRLRSKFLHSLVRKGFLAGYAHAGENVKIAEVLLTQLRPIIQRLGVEFVKHLKDVLPTVTGVLADPFGPSCPALLSTAATTSKVIIVNSWPRMAFHRGEVLKGLTVCWINLSKEDSDHADTKASLKEAAVLLQTALQNEVDIDKEFKELIATEKTLEGLFPPPQLAEGSKSHYTLETTPILA